MSDPLLRATRKGARPGATVREREALDGRQPGLASYLTDDAGRLRRHVNVSDPLGPDAEVFILKALSGG